MESCEIPLAIVSGVLLIGIVVTIVYHRKLLKKCNDSCPSRRKKYEKFDDENVPQKQSDGQDSYQRYRSESLTLQQQRTQQGLLDRINELESDLRREMREKEDALRRLSALMSSRLRDGNPNVVDLSDQNRPLKVGEQFSELYDNQWTDAFTALKENYQGKFYDQDIIKMLLIILTVCYVKCQEKSEEQLKKLKKKVKVIGELLYTETSNLADDLMQRIKEEKKMLALNYVPKVQDVAPDVNAQLEDAGLQPFEYDDLHPVTIYMQECLKLCFLMVSQDLPMVIDWKAESSSLDNFKAYLTSGAKILYVVWPVLYLEKGGAMVSKGVAEFEK